MIDPFFVYSTYIKAKVHFNRNDFDYFTYSKTKANYDSYLKRNDHYYFEVLSKKLNNRGEVLPYFVANFIKDRQFNITDWKQGMAEFKEWRARVERIEYNFEQDIIHLLDICERSNKKFQDLFIIQKGNSPAIVDICMRRFINLETLVIFRQLFKFKLFNTLTEFDIVYSDWELLVNKYSSFIKINEEKYKKLLYKYLT